MMPFLSLELSVLWHHSSSDTFRAWLRAASCLCLSSSYISLFLFLPPSYFFTPVTPCVFVSCTALYFLYCFAFVVSVLRLHLFPLVPRAPLFLILIIPPPVPPCSFVSSLCFSCSAFYLFLVFSFHLFLELLYLCSCFLLFLLILLLLLLLVSLRTY